MDLYPRDSKRQGGWIESLRMQFKENGNRVSPHLLIVCNLTKPTNKIPSLITSYEAETIFHEFGHALHVLLSDCEYSSLAGFNTLWDFVELPSQIMQSWLTEKDSFKIFARHYETGEVINDNDIEKIIKADRFMSGWTVLAQVGAAILDISWHTDKGIGVTDIEKFEEEVRGPYRFLKGYPGTSSTTSFKHIFTSGYDVGYYSYHWAEVLAADAFEYFKEKGLFSREVAEKFRANILSRGNTEDPTILYRSFRGRDADPSSLLRHKGLINS
jgi:Zn-dependent oligopeptidase